MTQAHELNESGRRIIHLSQPTTAGVAACVRMLARGGLAAGDAVRVICPAEGALASWVQSDGIGWMDADMKRELSFRDLRQLPRLRRVLRTADVVHLHSSKAGALGRLALLGIRRGRPRVVMTPHGWSWYVGGNRAGLYRLVEKLLAGSADALVAVSEQERIDGLEVLGDESAQRIVVIENGVDTAHYTPVGPVAERSPEPLIVCVGRLSVQKGQDLAIRMLAELPDRTARLRLIGDGPEGDSLLAAAAECGVLERVEFVAATDPRPHLRAADVVLMPSRWEGMSLLLLEAMACGACIVSTEVGGSDALSGAGVLVPLADPVTGLAAAVTGLLADPEQRAAWGALAGRRARERFGMDRMLLAYRAIWAQTRA